MYTLTEYKEIISAEIHAQLTHYRVQAAEIDPLFADLLEAMDVYTARGGKRFRPYLLYLAYVGGGGEDRKGIHQVGAALELIHTFLLIHDDIVDRDLERYGGLNIQGVYKEKFAHHFPENQAKQYGGDVALLAGDTAHLLSTRLITQADLTDTEKIAVLNSFTEVTLQVAGGELVDVLLSMNIPEVTADLERIIRVYTYKTAVYTVYLPLEVGLRLAGKKIDPILLKKIAIPLGIAFQLRDDLLGIFGETATTGKSADGDIREGKRTLLYAYALAKSGKNRAEFEQLYGLAGLTKDQAERVRVIIKESGACAEIEQLITQHTQEAQQSLPEVGLTKVVEGEFQKIIDKMIVRSQ